MLQWTDVDASSSNNSCRNKRRKHAQKDIQREKQTVGWKRKDRNDIIKRTVDEDEVLIALGFLLIWKRRKQRNKQKMKKNRAMWDRDIYKQRKEKDTYNTLKQELQLEDTEFYFK